MGGDSRLDELLGLGLPPALHRPEPESPRRERHRGHRGPPAHSLLGQHPEVEGSSRLHSCHSLPSKDLRLTSTPLWSAAIVEDRLRVPEPHGAVRPEGQQADDPWLVVFACGTRPATRRRPIVASRPMPQAPVHSGKLPARLVHAQRSSRSVVRSSTRTSGVVVWRTRHQERVEQTPLGSVQTSHGPLLRLLWV